ncbi:retrotransposon hot spot (RHS) protein, partial [Trypanosoma conorhini]
TVTEHEGADSIIAVLDDLARRGKKGYIIYDVSEEGAPPSSKLPPDGWGMILLASLKSGNFNTLAMQLHTSLTIMNCPDEKEVKAMCAWRTRGRPAQEQRKYWETVQDRMSQVGPMPRYILTEADFNEGTEVVNSALQAITASVARDYLDLEEGNIWCPGNPFQQFVKIERVSNTGGLVVIRCTSICRGLDSKVAQRMCEVLGPGECIARSWRASERRLRR